MFSSLTHPDRSVAAEINTHLYPVSDSPMTSKYFRCHKLVQGFKTNHCIVPEIDLVAR